MLVSVILFRLAILAAWNVSYGGMYDLCKILHNPFGNRRVDIAHEAIQKGLRTLGDNLLTATDHVMPPTMIQPGAARARVSTRVVPPPAELPAL